MKFQLLHISTLFMAALSAAQTNINIKVKECRPTDPTPGSLFELVKKSGMTKVAPNRVGYGRLQIVDGCRFRVTNFTLKPPGPRAYWAGVPKGQPEGQILARISPAALGSYDGHDADFALQGVSWSDMDGIGVYSEGDQTWYMIANWVALKGDLEDSAAGRSLLMSPMFTVAALLAGGLLIANARN